MFFYVDKSNACDVEKVKTEPEKVEDTYRASLKEVGLANPSHFLLLLWCCLATKEASYVFL